MSITVPATPTRQAVAESGARGRREAVLERWAERERHRAVDETDETDQWGGARTPEAQALLLSRAVALGLDRLLYEP
ncbi:MAG: hypothetical protein ACM3ML_04825 [Micromonosporaceae bacterium]